MSSPHPQFWKIAASQMGLQLLQHEQQAQMAQAIQRHRKVFTNAGLDPDQQYTLNVETEAIVPAATAEDVRS